MRNDSDRLQWQTEKNYIMNAQSSIVILDDGSAAKLPAIPGRFIIRNGSGSDEIIQAYYYHQ